MVKKSAYIVFIGILVIVGGFQLVSYSKSTDENLALREVEVNSSVKGITPFDLTLENIINEFSTNVLNGTVEGKELLNNDREVYKVSVQEQILGETNSKDILVYTGNDDNLEKGGTYLFTLSTYSSPLYDKDFYVQPDNFIIKIFDDGKLGRLVDVFDKKYEPPFENEKFNNNKALISYIKSNFKKEMKNNKVVNKIDSTDSLIDAADHVVQVIIVDIVESKNGIAVVNYEILSKLKNGDMTNAHQLLLPKNSIEKDGEYLLFLSEGEQGDIKLTTRGNSVISNKDNKFNDILELFNKN